MEEERWCQLNREILTACCAKSLHGETASALDESTDGQIEMRKCCKSLTDGDGRMGEPRFSLASCFLDRKGKRGR